MDSPVSGAVVIERLRRNVKADRDTLGTDLIADALVIIGALINAGDRGVDLTCSRDR